MPKGEGLYPAPTKKRIDDLDARISNIQKGTRALIPAVVPLHDILRQKFRWYYRWTAMPASKTINILVLFIYIFGASWFGINSLATSKANIDFAPGAEKNIDYSTIYKSVKPDAKEVLAQRTENQKVFQNPDGTQQYIISGGPLHYKDANNAFKNIDSSIVVKEDNSGFAMDKSIYSADFNKEFTADPLVQISKDDQNLSMKPGELSLSNATENQLISTPKNSTGEGNGHQIIYKNAYGPGLDFSYETQDLQLNKKLNITTFESLPAPTIDMTSETDANLKFQLQFGINAGLELFIDDQPWDGSQTTIENQNLIFKKDGKTLWQLTPPKAWDSTYDSNNQSLVQRSSELAEERSWITGKAVISKTDDKLNMSILFPYSWLKTAQYPVTIDPDTYYGAATDGHILAQQPDYATARLTSLSYSDAVDALNVGQSMGPPVSYRVYRGFVEFDTSGIDDSYVVTQANLYLTAKTDSTTGADFTLRIHKYNWTSPLATGTREADFDGGLASTYDADWRSTSGISVNTSYGSSNLDSTWIQKGATKTQYALISDRDISANFSSGTEYLAIYSQEVATQAYRPYLSITASVPTFTRYWIDNDGGNWSDTANWSDASGGSGGASVPVAGDTAIFDNAGGTHNGNLTLDTNVNVGTLTFDTNYTGTITQGTYTITTAAAMSLIGTNLTAGADIIASGTLTIGTGKTLDINGHNITVTGAFTNNGTLKQTGSETTVNLTNDSAHGTVEYSATSGTRNIRNWTYFNLKINGSGGTFTLPGAITANGDLTVLAGTMSIATNTLTVRDFSLTGTLSIGASASTGLTTRGFTVGSGGVFSCSGACKINVSGDFDNANSTTFSRGNSLFTFTGTSTINCGGNYWGPNSFYSIALAQPGQTTRLNSTITAYNSIHLGTGTLVSASGQRLSLNNATNANQFIDDGVTYGTAPAKANVQFLQTSTNPAAPNVVPGYTYPNLDISCNLGNDTTKPICYSQIQNANLTATALTLTTNQGTAGTSYVDSNGYNITVNGDLGLGYVNKRTGQLKISDGKTLDVTGNITIQDGSGNTNRSTLISGAGSLIKLKGNWTNNDTFTAGTGTAEFYGTGTQTLNSGGTGATQLFNNLTHSGAGTLQLLTNNINIDGNFTNSAGTFNTNSLDMTVAGNVNLTGGTFTQGTRTITLDGAATQLFTAGGTGAGHTPYNLTLANTSGVSAGVTFTDSLTLDTGGRLTDTTQDSRVIFADNGTYTIPLITITGAAAHNILLQKGTGSHGHWHFVVAGTPAVSYATPSNSDATGSGAAITGGTDGGNNTNWDFGAAVPNAPTIGTPTVQSATSIRWAFTDNSSNETGFKVYDGSNTLKATCATADLAYCDEVGMAVNTLFNDRYVVAYNGNGNSTNSATVAAIYTLANTPLAPTVNQIYGQPTQLQLIVGVNTNPASTQFTIHETQQSGNKYVQANGSLNTDAVWQTFAQWGSETGTTITGLTAGTQYTFEVKARNGDTTETAFGTPGSQQTTVGAGNTVSGSLYNGIGGTKISAAKTIHISVNGNAAATTETSAGDYTITANEPLDANDIITVFVSGETEKASTVTKVSATGNLTGIDLFQNYTTIRHEGTIASLTNTDLATVDNIADTDILFSVDGSNIASYTQGLYILATKTYAPGADINIVGSYTNAGTFTKGTGTVTFNGTATSKTINPGASSFYNLTFNGSGGAWSPLTNTLTVTNDLTMTAGTFDTSNGTANATVNGNVACGATCGTINMTAGTFTQNVAANKAFGTSVAGTTAWTFNNLTFASSAGTPTITTSTTGTGDITVNAVLNIAASTTWDAGNRTYHLMGTGMPFMVSGTFAYNTSTMSYENTTSANIAGSTVQFWNLQTNPASGTPTYSFIPAGSQSFLSGTKVLTENGEENIENFKIGDKVLSYDIESNQPIISEVTNTTQGTKDSYYIINNKVKTTGNHVFILPDNSQKRVEDLKVGDVLKTHTGQETINSIDKINQTVNVYDIEVKDYHLFFAENFLVHNPSYTTTINNNLTLTGNGSAIVNVNDQGGAYPFTIAVKGDFSIGASQTFQASYATNIQGNYTNLGTFTHNGGTVTFNGTATGKTINPGASSFCELIFNGSGGAWSPLTNTLTATYSLTMTAGTLNNATGSADVVVNGTVAGTAGIINMTTGTFTQRIAAAKNFGTTSGSTNWTFNNLNFENSSGSDRIITTLGTATGQIIVGGTLTVGKATDSNTTTLNNETNDRIIDANGAVNITSKGVLSASSTASFTVAGNWTNSGTFTAGTGAVTFDGPAAQTITGTNTWYNLTINNTTASPSDSVDVDPGAAQTVTNTLTVTDGQWTPCTGDSYKDVSIGAAGIMKPDVSASISVSGNWTKSGSFTSNSGTVTMTGSSASIAGAFPTTFNNLTINSAGTVTGNTGPSINGTLTITGTLAVPSAKTITFYGASPTLTINASSYLNGAGTILHSVGATGSIGLNLTNNGIIDVANFDFTIAGYAPGTTYTIPATTYGVSTSTNVSIIGSNYAGLNFIIGSGTLKVKGNLNFVDTGDGGPVSLTNSNNSNIEIGGNLTKSGTFTYTKGTETITFNGTGAQTLDGSLGSFHNLTIANTIAIVSLAAQTTLSGTLTINSGATLSASASNYNLTVAGNWINSGTFTAGTGAVTFNSANPATITGSTTFNNLVMNTTTDGAKTINFTNGTTQTVQDTWTLDGASGKVLTLQSTLPGTAWKFVIPSDFTAGDYIDVRDSQNTTNAYRITPGANTTDSGNNDPGWNFAPAAPTIGTPVVASATAIEWHFTDTSSNETGFKVYDSSDNLVATCATANLTYCTETGLSVNTQYTGRYVVAYNAIGNSSHSAAAASIYTLANTPSAPTLSNVAGQTDQLMTIITAGDSNPAITTYALHETSTNKYLQADGSLNTSAVYQTAAIWGIKTVTGLSANTNYTFEAKAKNGDGVATISFGPTASKYTLIQVPTGISFGSVNDDSIAMSATGSLSNLSTDLSGIQFTETSGNPGAGGQGGFNPLWTNTNNATDTGLSLGIQYSYKVKARNGDGVQTTETSVYNQTTTTSGLTAPTTASLTVNSSTALTAGWADNSASETGFKVFVSTVSNADCSLATYHGSPDYTTDAQIESQALTSLDTNTQYCIKVLATTGLVDSSPVYAAAPLYTLIETPSGISFDMIAANSIILSSANTPSNLTAGSSGLVFTETSGNPGGGGDVCFTNTTDNTCTDTGLSVNTQYSYKVKAKNGDGVATDETTVLNKYTLANTPTVPTVIADYNETDGYFTDLTLHTNGNPDGTQYKINTGDWQAQNDGATQKQTGLDCNQNYTYSVLARNGDLIETTNIEGMDTTPLCAPVGLIETNLTTVSVTLGWSAVEETNSVYDVSLGTDTAATNLGVTSNINDLNLTQESLDPATVYYYKVRAHNDNGTGAWSTVNKFTTTTITANPAAPVSSDTTTATTTTNEEGISCSEKPSAPSNLRATDIGSTNLSLAWAPSAAPCKLKTYDVFNAHTGIKIASVTDESLDLANLGPNISYSFYVAAIDAAGNTSEPSNTMTIKTLKSGEDVSNAGNVCHIGGGQVAFLILGNTPTEIASGQTFPENVLVKVMVADGGGELCDDYRGLVYFTSTDSKAALTWNINHPYSFTAQDAGQHEFNGLDFRLLSQGNQILTITDKQVSGQAEIRVIAGSIIFQKAQETMTNFFDHNSMKVNTAVVATTTVLLLTPVLVNVVIGLSNFLPQIIYWFTLMLLLIGIRKKRKPWGVVFNSQTGQPVSLATVRIFDKEHKRLLESAITDKKGRFGMLVRPGTFYLVVSKTGFKFPSQFKVSEFFENVYAGGNVHIDPKKDKTVNLNIPLDPAEKASVVFSFWATIVKFNRFLQKVRVPVIVIGSIFAVVMIIVAYHIIYVLSLILYAFFFVLEITRSKKSRPYGVVSDVFGNPLETAIVRIFNKRSNRLIATDVTDTQGRFNFFVDPGIYYVMTAKPGYMDFKSHIMYLEGERTKVTVNIKLKKVEKQSPGKIRNW